MSDSDINASNQAQLAAQQAAKNTNDLNAKQAGLLLASQEVLVKSAQDAVAIPAGLAAAIQRSRNDPEIWNKFTPAEQQQLLIDQVDYEKLAVDLQRTANQVKVASEQSKVELSQMTFNGQKLDTNIALTEQSLRENFDVPAEFTRAEASTIYDPAGDVNNLIPPPVGKISSVYSTTIPANDVAESVFDPGQTYNGPATEESVFDPRQDPGENVFDPGTTYNGPATEESVFDPRQDVGENVFDPGTTYNGPATQESVFDPRQDVGENVFDPGQTYNGPATEE
jgi:hypothetical protein